MATVGGSSNLHPIDQTKVEGTQSEIKKTESEQAPSVGHIRGHDYQQGGSGKISKSIIGFFDEGAKPKSDSTAATKFRSINLGNGSNSKVDPKAIQNLFEKASGNELTASEKHAIINEHAGHGQEIESEDAPPSYEQVMKEKQGEPGVKTPNSRPELTSSQRNAITNEHAGHEDKKEVRQDSKTSHPELTRAQKHAIMNEHAGHEDKKEVRRDSKTSHPELTRAQKNAIMNEHAGHKDKKDVDKDSHSSHSELSSSQRDAIINEHTKSNRRAADQLEKDVTNEHKRRRGR